MKLEEGNEEVFGLDGVSSDEDDEEEVDLGIYKVENNEDIIEKEKYKGNNKLKINTNWLIFIIIIKYNGSINLNNLNIILINFNKIYFKLILKF